jgi:hypothetical protein
MKKLILAAIALTTAAGVFAQGTVIFVNRTSLGTTHVWGPGTGAASTISVVGLGSNDAPTPGSAQFPTGSTMIGAAGTAGQYGAATTFAQLLAFNGTTANEASLVPMGITTTFRTGTVQGVLTSVNDTLAGLAGDGATPATLEMVAWDNSSGLYSTWTLADVAWTQGLIAAGKSGLMNLPATGGGLTATPNINPSHEMQTQPRLEMHSRRSGTMQGSVEVQDCSPV